MRRLLTMAVAAVLLLVGSTLAPAPVEADVPPGFWYLAPYTNLDLTFGTCYARFTYGQYGNVAYATMTALNGGCSTLSRVRVATWGDTSTACSYLHDEPDCWHSGSVVQAVAVGPLIWGWWEIHTGASSIQLYFWPFP